jgi:hypothetical protein
MKGRGRRPCLLPSATQGHGREATGAHCDSGTHHLRLAQAAIQDRSESRSYSAPRTAVDEDDEGGLGIYLPGIGFHPSKEADGDPDTEEQGLAVHILKWVGWPVF